MGRPLDTFVWALSISQSRLLAHVRSGPKGGRLANEASDKSWPPTSVFKPIFNYRSFHLAGANRPAHIGSSETRV